MDTADPQPFYPVPYAPPHHHALAGPAVPPPPPPPPSSSSGGSSPTSALAATKAAVPADDPRRTHKCPQCSKAFTTSGHLARHIKIHTGERAHKCPFPGCETRCSRQDNLQQHYRIHLSLDSKRLPAAQTREHMKRGLGPDEHSDTECGSPSRSARRRRRNDTELVDRSAPPPPPSPPLTPPPLEQASMDVLLGLRAPNVLPSHTPPTPIYGVPAAHIGPDGRPRPPLHGDRGYGDPVVLRPGSPAPARAPAPYHPGPLSYQEQARRAAPPRADHAPHAWSSSSSGASTPAAGAYDGGSYMDHGAPHARPTLRVQTQTQAPHPAYPTSSYDPYGFGRPDTPSPVVSAAASAFPSRAPSAAPAPAPYQHQHQQYHRLTPPASLAGSSSRTSSPGPAEPYRAAPPRARLPGLAALLQPEPASHGGYASYYAAPQPSAYAPRGASPPPVLPPLHALASGAAPRSTTDPVRYAARARAPPPSYAGQPYLPQTLPPLGGRW